MRSYSYLKSMSCALQFVSLKNKEENYSEVYGSLYSSAPMGYNFQIEVTGEAGASDLIKNVCLEIHDFYDHTFINELEPFEEKVPTFEVIALEMFNLAKLRLGKNLFSIQFFIDNRSWVKVYNSMQVEITKTYKINCVHRHHNPNLTMVENKDLYGKCSAIHGHEYTVEVSLLGNINSEGVILNHDKFSQIVNDNLINKYHKTYLNEEMGNTSGELISELFYKNLHDKWPQETSFKLKLRETRKNSFVKY